MAIVYAYDLQIIGALAVMGAVVLAVGALWAETERTIVRARERRRRRIERELRLRARCGACGATNRVDFVDPNSDVAYALEAGLDIVDRVREQRRRRRAS